MLFLGVFFSSNVCSVVLSHNYLIFHFFSPSFCTDAALSLLLGEGELAILLLDEMEPSRQAGSGGLQGQEPGYVLIEVCAEAGIELFIKQITSSWSWYT